MSIRDVARHVGVDPSTVSLALNGSPRVAESTRERVVTAAEDLGYRPNALAQALRRGSTRSVGILAASLDIPFFVDLLKAQERWLVDHNYSVLFANARGRSEVAVRLLDDMGARHVDGLCIGYPDADNSTVYRDLVASGISLSFYAEKQHLSWVEDTGASVAVCDMSRGCFGLIEHLFQLGHRRIAFMGYVLDRETDYVQAMQELGLQMDPSWSINPTVLPGRLSQACAQFAALRPRPTALFTQSDEMAARIVTELVRLGIRVPADVSVVGVNNNPMGALVRVPLTTLALPTDAIGRWMAEAVVGQLESREPSGDLRFFPTEVVVRESTAPAKE